MSCFERFLACAWRFSALVPVAVSLVGGMARPVFTQEKPLERGFSVATASSFRIQLSVRSEIEGQQPVQIGAKAYVKPFSRAVEAGVGWIATRRVLGVAPDGTAEIEEALADFREFAKNVATTNEETAKLHEALRNSLTHWSTTRTLRYRETRAGQLLGLAAEGIPQLDEELPRLLSLWLVRALRPTVALPPNPIRYDEAWQEPRAVQLPNWTDVRGSETGEWLAAPQSSESAVRLHIVQRISGSVVSGPEKPPEGTAHARFYGESLSTISLTDARLLSASRSATRETVWALAAVEGLRERPQFRARLSVQVQIESCNETPCILSGPAGRPALGDSR